MQLTMMHSSGDRTKFQYQLGWARSYLKRAGAIKNLDRAVWQITPRGAAMSASELNAIISSVRAENRSRLAHAAKENG
jgi:restriction system protein